MIDPGLEAPALRRTRVLLSRVREDGLVTADVEGLNGVVDELWRAVSDGRLLDPSSIDRLDSKLALLREPSIAEGEVRVQDLLLHNAFVEAHELIARLRMPPKRTRQTGSRTPQPRSA